MHLHTDTRPAASTGIRMQRSGGYGGWYERTSKAILERPKAVDLVVILISLGLDFLGDTRFQSTEFPLALVVMTLATGSLYWRRSYPAVVLAVTVVSYGYLVLEYQSGLFAAAFALYAWIVYGPSQRLVWAGTIAAVVPVLAIEIYATQDFDDGRINFLIGVAINLGLIAGTADRAVQRRRYLNEVEERVARLETEQELAVSVAAQEERARVAREMHDVVAHSVSVMLVQATAAKWVLDTSPEQSKTALENIETSGREALTDLRRVLGLLREKDAPDYTPNPTLARIPELIATAQAAEHLVTYTLEGDHVVPVGVQTTIYRITQEALTNVMKHAGTNVTVSVKIITTSSEAKVRIVDDGRGAAATTRAGRPGLGLVGMNERVQAFGGELFTRPRTGGGFEVRAVLPYLLPTEVSVQLADTTS